MKFLCCGKGDRSDGEDQPPRPARIPDKVAPLKAADSSVKITAPTSPPTLSEDVPIAQETPETPENPEKPDLWKEAFDSLSEERQKLVSEGETGSTTDAIKGVISDTREKYTEWQKSGLKVKRANGEDIDIRDGAEKIISAALQAQDLITNIVAFDPTGKASAAWAVVSLGLTMVSTDIERRDAMFASSEYLAEKLAYYALVDKHYRDNQVEGGQNFDSALLEVYTAILEYTAEVTKVQKESTIGRIMRSIKSIDEQHLPQLQKTIEAKQAEAEKWANLVNTINDRARAQKILNDVDESLALTKKVYSKILNDEEIKIMDWLSTFDYSVPHQRTQEYRTPETGTWLLDSQEYKDWKSFPGSVMWLPGVVGCGKSVLCSTVIKDIERLCETDSSKSLGYWYYEFTQHDSQSVEMMMRSLIRQLSQSPLSPSVRNCWEVNSKKGSQPSRETIVTMLGDVVSDMPSDVFLVLDALDECPTNGKERSHLLSLLVSLADTQRKNIHILVTSRPEQDIKAAMGKFPSINLEEKQAKDVEIFVRTALEEEEKLQDVDEDIKSSILKALLNTGERSFRWADLQLKRFKDCLTNEEIRAALVAIPQTLKETYQGIVDKITRDKKQSYARQMLMLCAFPAAPLDLETIGSSVKLRSCDFVISICTTSLLAVSNDIVRLAHFSVKEFLVVPNNSDDSEGCRFSEIAAREMLATKTVDLLLKQTEELAEEAVRKNRFLIYAASHWQNHVAALGDISLWPVGLPDKVDRLFTESTIYLNWSRIAKRAEGLTSHWSRLPRHCLSPITLASKFTMTGELSLERTVRLLIEQGANPMDEKMWSPILMIAGLGDLELLEMSLKKDFPITLPLSDRVLLRLSLGDDSEMSDASRMKLRAVLNTLREFGCLYDSWRSSVKTPVDQITDRTLGRRILSRVLRNESVGLEMLRQLLDWRDMGLISFAFPSNTLTHVVGRKRDRDEILDLLFGKHNVEIPIPQEILDPESGDVVFGEIDPDIIFDIMLRKPAAFKMQEPSLSSTAQHLSTKQMDLVLQSFPDTFVTEGVLAGAARNSSHTEMLSFLWPRREQGVSVTEDILVGAASNSSPVSLKFVISELGPDTRLKDCVMEQLIGKSGVSMIKMLWESQKIKFEVSAKVIEAAMSRPDDPLEMLEMLDSFSKNSVSEVPVTESLVSAAASHPKYAKSLVSYLCRMQQQPIPVTEEALLNALKQDDSSVANTLMDKCLEVPLSDEVFIAACSHPSILSRLLDKCSDSVPVEEIIAKFDSEKPPIEVLDLLFDRKLLDVDEQLLETMAKRYDTLATVLSRAPDTPIPDDVLMIATTDARSIRMLLEKRSIDTQTAECIIGYTILQKASSQFQEIVESILERVGPAALTADVFEALFEEFFLFDFAIPWLCAQLQSGDDPFTEDVLVAAVKKCDSTELKQVLTAVIDRTGSVSITEKILLEMSINVGACDIIPWLFEERQNIRTPSLEDTSIAAANLDTSKEFQEVVESLIDYMGSDFITEKVFRATVSHCLPDAFQWLCDQRPDFSLTWEGTCRTILEDTDIAAEDKVMPLLCLELPVDSDSPKISPSLLAKYPYDLENGNNYGLDDLVNGLVSDPDEEEGLPISDPQGMAGIVLERCGLLAVNNFLKALPEVVISDTLIEAAKKNVVANQDELVSLLEKERDTRATAPE